MMGHRIKKLSQLLIVSLLFFSWSATSSIAQKRIALVIGNANYTLLQSLPSPGNDSQLMTQTLRKLGFEVISTTDVDYFGMLKAVKKFSGKLRSAGKDAVGLFYFSGYGVQSRGQNYLLPLGAKTSSNADIDKTTIKVSQVLAQMQAAGDKLNLLILDASRNNTISRNGRSISRGLAPTKIPPGTIIALAAAPGFVSLDGNHKNSIYTETLVKAMQVPGLSVMEMFKLVRKLVSTQTDGLQTTWEQSSLKDNFVFVPASQLVAGVRIINPPPISFEISPPMGFEPPLDRNTQTPVKTVKEPSGSGFFSNGMGMVAVRRQKRKMLAIRRQKQKMVASSRQMQKLSLNKKSKSAAIARRKLTRKSQPRSLATPAPADDSLISIPSKPKIKTMVLPEFPWPPPEPSVQMRLPIKPIIKSMDLKNVATIITSSLRQAGFWEYSFYRVPNGFALITRLEQINEDGSRTSESVRYRMPSDEETFSLAAYIKRLFFASPGYYRLIVFIVTDIPFTASGDVINEREAIKILRDGVNALPSEFKQKKFSDAYGVDALIYEFRKGSSDGQVSILLPGRLSPLIHFKKAGLLAAFDMQKN